MTRFQVWPDAWPQSHPDGWPEGPVRLNNVLVPLGSVGLEVVKNPGGARSGDREGFMRTSLTIREGRIAEPMGDETALDCAGALVMPGFVDCHTHLDKGHIWRRTPNPDGTFDGALNAVAGDREKCWSGEDVAARMAFSLEAAHAHGTVAIRTHLDSGDARSESTWEAFAQARETWAGRVALQGAALTTLEDVFSDDFERLADLVATHEGVLGAVTYPLPDMPARLDRFFKLAADRGLNADFHADESLNPESETLREIAEARLRNNFEGRVLAGHCCSLAILPEDQADRTMDLVAEAGIDIVSLPLCNLYLQDRVPGRTPRYRGVTLVHELVARGVNVSFASDNTRDPFYAYGDLDMVEVLREATRIAHLDHPVGDWPASFAANPARAMGLTGGTLTPGAPADFVIFPAARGWTELNARPQSDRVVIRGGRPLGTAAPAYDRLDPVVIEGSAHTAVAPDIAGAKAALAHLDLDDHPKTVLQKSRDFYWYSPVLKAKLEGVTADFVIAPRSVDEVVEVMRVAYAHNVPVTTRGSGTGNYGQAMPLSGGIVLHMKHMTKILELEHGRILAEAGIVLADLDRETREKTNQELRIHPSTHGTASLGGFIAGGSGGVGSIRWGGLRAPGNILSLTIVTCEAEPRVIELRGDDIQKANHAYGVNGAIVAVGMPLAPAYSWVDVIVGFDDVVEATRAGMTLAREDAILLKQLCSVADPVPHQYFLRHRKYLPEGKSVLIASVASQSLDALLTVMNRWEGASVLFNAAVDDTAGLPPAYELGWNHTTLRALRVDPSITYLQTAYLGADPLASMAKMRDMFGDEVPIHTEITRFDGQIQLSGLPLVRYSSEARLEEIIAAHEDNDCPIFNPHRYTLEEGGMKETDQVQLAFKRECDPKGLLNPGKMIAWDDPDWDFDQERFYTYPGLKSS